MRRIDNKARFYAELPKNKAKLMLCYELGELNLRGNRKTEALKKIGSIKCLVNSCMENDTLEHIKECHGYNSKLKDGAGPYELIDFLTAIELERNRKFNRSLVNFKTIYNSC